MSDTLRTYYTGVYLVIYDCCSQPLLCHRSCMCTCLNHAQLIYPASTLNITHVIKCTRLSPFLVGRAWEQSYPWGREQGVLHYSGQTSGKSAPERPSTSQEDFIWPAQEGRWDCVWDAYAQTGINCFSFEAHAQALSCLLPKRMSSLDAVLTVVCSTPSQRWTCSHQDDLWTCWQLSQSTSQPWIFP